MDTAHFVENPLASPLKKILAQPGTVLLLESDASLRRVLSVTLGQLKMKVLEAADAKIACQILEQETPELLILEFEMLGGANGDVIDAFRKKNGDQRGVVLLMTTQRPDDRWRQRYQPDLVVYKPFDVRYLTRCIQGSG